MRITSPALLRASAMLLLLSGPFVPALPAASTVVAYTYFGTLTKVSAQAALPVSQGGLGLAVGDFVNGSFSYDSSQPQSATKGVFVYTGSGKVHTFTTTIFTNSSMTTQLFTDSYSKNVTAFYSNTVTSAGAGQAAALAISGDTIYKSALGITGASNPAFVLTLNNPTGAGGFSPTNLPNPNPTLAKNFINVGGTLHWDPPTPQSATGLSWDANVHFVPEPSTAVLAGFGVVACGAGIAVSRRRATRTARTS